MTLTEWKAPFQVNTGAAATGGQSDYKLIGLANGWILSVWDEGQNGAIGTSPRGDIVAKIYNADLGVVYDAFELNSYFFADNESSVDVTATHDGFAIAFLDWSDGQYFDERAVRVERFDIDGPLGFHTIATETSDTLFFPKIAANLTPDNDDIIATYYNFTRHFSGGRTVNENDALGPVFQSSPAVAGSDVIVSDAAVLDNGNFLLSHTLRPMLGSDNKASAGFSIYSPTGTVLVSDVTAATDIDSSSTAVLAGGGFVIAYRKDTDIHTRIFDSSGNAVGSGPVQSIPGINYAGPDVIGLHDGGFVLVWDTRPGNDVWARRFDASGAPQGDAIFVGAGGSFNSAVPTVGLSSDGRILFAWEGPNNEIFASVWDPRGETIDPDVYGQIRTNFLATDVITTGIGGSIVLEGAPGDIILGQAGDDIIHTSRSGEFWGGGGNDTFILSASFPLAGDERYIDGEAGIDTLDTRAVSVDYTIDLETGVTDFPGAVATAVERVLDIENVITGAGDDRIIGSAFGNEITTHAGADTVLAGDGADVVRGGTGDDSLEGGEGDDRLNGGAGDDVVKGGAGDDRIFAEAGNDSVLGGDGNDSVEGKSGDDTILGGGGADTLRGADGSDVIDGGSGQDLVFGGNDDDTILGGDGNDTLYGNGGSDSIDGGLKDDVVVGGTGDDILRGGEGQDTLRGGGGNDTMSGDGGDDLLFGSSGEDVMEGGAGNDVLQGDAQADHLSGGEGDDVLRGDDGFDTLSGVAGDDLLFGGNGADLLVGGLGADTLRGQGGNDVFRFESVPESSAGASDVIDGIDGIGASGGDILDLSAIDADALLAGEDAFTFLGVQSRDAALAFGAGALWVEDVGTQTRLFGNIDGDPDIEFMVRINDGADVTAADYDAGDFLL